MKLHIKEGLKQVDSDMFITDYVGDVVNLFINKPKPYRVVYNKIGDIYGIGNAYKYIHGDIENALAENGYQNKDFYSNRENYTNIKSITFVPYLTTDNSWEVIGFEGERSNPLYIKTGIILSNYDLKTTIPDLYNKLKNNKWLITTDMDDVIKLLRVYSKELEHLRKQAKNYLKQFQEAGFNIRPEYKGIPNFKYYIDLIDSNSDTVWWLGNEPHVMIGTTDMFYYPEDREERMDFIGKLGKVGGEEGGLEYDLDGNLSIQCNKYTQIKKLLDDANLPYDVAFKYV